MKMKMKISGASDSEYMRDPTRRSVNGWSCFLEGCPINCASKVNYANYSFVGDGS